MAGLYSAAILESLPNLAGRTGGSGGTSSGIAAFRDSRGRIELSFVLCVS